MSIVDNKISAKDLNKVVMVNSIKESKKVLSNQDLMYQEERRKRKVRKLDFEVK